MRQEDRVVDEGRAVEGQGGRRGFGGGIGRQSSGVRGDGRRRGNPSPTERLGVDDKVDSGQSRERDRKVDGEGDSQADGEE